MPKTVLITGANKGIGLEFAKQYAKDGWRVVACCREPDRARDLKALLKIYPAIQIEKLDVTELKDIQKLASKLKNQPIDVLINNAGIYGGSGAYGGTEQRFGKISVENMQEIFLINAIAPLKIAEAFVENLAKSELKILVSISSNMGSIHHTASGEAYGYSASKAALNMIMKCVAGDLKNKKIRVLLLHPGWVQTDMGGPDARIDVETSVLGMRKVIAEKLRDRQGLFFSFSGEEMPW